MRVVSETFIITDTVMSYMELSHRTYDWDRLHNRGNAFVNVLTQATTLSGSDPTTLANTLEQHSTDAWRDGPRHYETDTGAIRLELPDGDEAWRTYDLSFDITTAGRISAHFAISPDFADDRVLYDGFVDTTPPDGDWLRAVLAYYFETCRDAIDIAADTLLSPRESEVVLLKQEGYDADTIADLMNITTSNVTQYEERIAEKREQATAQIATGERTLALLPEPDVAANE